VGANAGKIQKRVGEDIKSLRVAPQEKSPLQKTLQRKTLQERLEDAQLLVRTDRKNQRKPKNSNQKHWKDKGGSRCKPFTRKPKKSCDEEPPAAEGCKACTKNPPASIPLLGGMARIPQTAPGPPP